MLGKFEALANQIVEHIGGVGNIDSLTHCMTRLRFALKEPGAANVEALKALKGVQGVVTSNGQFQVVIGTDVPAVYDEIVKHGSFGTTTVSAPSDEKVGPVAKVLGAITAIFQPILPAICGAGMIRAVLALLVFLNAIDSSSLSAILLDRLMYQELRNALESSYACAIIRKSSLVQRGEPMLRQIQYFQAVVRNNSFKVY